MKGSYQLLLVTKGSMHGVQGDLW